MAENDKTHVSRRVLLSGIAGATGAFLLPENMAGDVTNGAVENPVQDSTKVPGTPARSLGERAASEQPRRIVSSSPGGVSRTPLQDLQGIITPSDLHYERHHAGIPTIDARQYSLLVHGMVDRPTVFTLDDLKRFPASSRIHFLECSGNGGTGLSGNPPPDRTPQQIDGLASASEWIGVRLSTIFREVGVQPTAKWFLAEGMDAAMMSRSIPIDEALDDAIIAYGQNGEALRPEQGYPARLFVPGYEGSANVKWLRRIEFSDRPFMTRMETARYTDPLRDGKARMFSLVMDAKSLITSPTFPTTLTAPGWHEVSGLAWSGRGKIERVEVSVDGGQSWVDAKLQEPILSKCFSRFRHLWNWTGSAAVLMSRATDETGYTQPTAAAIRAARGPGTRYHYNHIRAWTVARDGSVTFGGAE